MTYSNSDVRVRRPVSKPLPAAKTAETKPLARRRPAARPFLRSAIVAAAVTFAALTAPSFAGEPSAPPAAVTAAQPARPGLSPLNAIFVALGGSVALYSLVANLCREPLS